MISSDHQTCFIPESENFCFYYVKMLHLPFFELFSVSLGEDIFIVSIKFFPGWEVPVLDKGA